MPEGGSLSTQGCCEETSAALSLDEAWERVDGMFSCALEIREVPLLESLGRVLAHAVVSPVDLPPFDNSAMDGYAFSHESLRNAPGGQLHRSPDRVAAGSQLLSPLSAGCAVRIFTGAPLPQGADTVAMQEHCVATDDFVSLPKDIELGANCRAAGDDVRHGQTVLMQGMRLRPQDLAMAAAMGFDRLPIYRPLRVAVLSTGDELNEPGQNRPQSGIYDSNRFGVLSLLRYMGLDTVDLGIVRDDENLIADVLCEAARQADLVLTSGGMSVGEEDHVKGAISRLGELAFWRINIKPGKPVGIGTIEGTPLIGLPGNPVSALVTFQLIARPVLLRLAGCRQTRPFSFQIESAFDHAAKSGRREFLRGKLVQGDAGNTQVNKFRTDSSGVLSSLVETDGLIDMGETGNVRKGQMVTFMPFGMLR